jgi:hypothetical protein
MVKNESVFLLPKICTRNPGLSGKRQTPSPGKKLLSNKD